MSALRTVAPAKVNLALAVTGRRADGYHELRSIFLRLALGDDLSAEVRPDADRDTLEVIGDVGGPTEDNLVLHAASDLRTSSGPLPSLHFTLTKHIPVAAGLGGGSSDAAAAMELALAAWGARQHPSARLGAAMRLGADVPFFAAGHAAALIHGIGEGLTQLPPPESAAGLVLVTPRQRLATADVFAELDRAGGGPAGTAERVESLGGSPALRIDAVGLVAMASELRDANDLWAPAARLAPDLPATRDAVEAALQRPLLLTGSGPTLFAVYPSEAAASRAADHLRAERLSELESADIIATSTTRTGERS